MYNHIIIPILNSYFNFKSLHQIFEGIFFAIEIFFDTADLGKESNSKYILFALSTPNFCLCTPRRIFVFAPVLNALIHFLN